MDLLLINQIFVRSKGKGKFNGVAVNTFGCHSGEPKLYSKPDVDAHLIVFLFLPFAGLHK